MAKPIVLGVQGHAAELVQRAGCGICIEPENETQLIAALEQLADDRELGAALGRAGRDYFVRRFDRAALAADYLGVIRRVREHDTAEPVRPAGDVAAESGQTAATRARELTLVPPAREQDLVKTPRAAGRA